MHVDNAAAVGWSTAQEARMSEVTIIGGGIARLAAAMRLSERGCRCTILEQSDTLGGKLGRTSTQARVIGTNTRTTCTSTGT